MSPLNSMVEGTDVCVDELHQEIAGFLEARTSLSDLGPDTDLLETGALNSILVVELIVFLESKYAVHLNGGDIAPRHFRSVAHVARLVRDKRQFHGHTLS